jgi:hypothetical protein
MKEIGMSMSNAAFSAQDWFKALCDKAGLKEATAAQASKYRRGFGIAYTTSKNKTLGSKVDENKGPDELADAQRTQGGKPSRINDYGPYSATPWNNKPAPHPDANKAAGTTKRIQKTVKAAVKALTEEPVSK